MERPWRSDNPVLWGLTGAAIGGLVWAFRSTFGAMADIWLTATNFNHCVFIAPASVFLIWRRRHRLAQIPSRASVTGALLFVGCAILWILGALGNISTVQNLAAVAMIAAAIWAVAGRAVAREIAFPLAYLFFMVPIGEFLIPPLMELTADVTVRAARLSGVSVYKDGLFFVIPNGSFKIVEACSGLRILIAALAVCMLFAHLTFISWTRRLVFVAATILMSLLANGLRAYVVVMAGYYSGMEAISSHVFLGYVVFAIVIFAMVLVGSRYSDIDHDAFRRIPVVTMQPGAPAWGSVVAAAVIVVLAAVTPATATAIKIRAASTPAPPPSMLLPVARRDWSGPMDARTDWSPQFIGVDILQAGAYRKNTNVVDAWILFYARQEQGFEVINAQNKMFDRRDWVQLHNEIVGATSTGGGSVPYIQNTLRGSAGGKRLIRYWYVVDGKPRYRAIEIKLRELGNSVLGRPTPATLIAIGTKFVDDEAAAAQTLDAFTRDVYATAYPPGISID